MVSTEVAEELQTATPAPEPGTVRLKDVIHLPDEELATPMAVSTLTSAGYVFVYDILTGERSVVNRNMLPAILQKKREDGTRVFSVHRPKVKPRRGTLRCLLHSSNPNRAHYDELGLAVCTKSNLTSEFQRRRHMRFKHKMEWETIEEERVRAEQEEAKGYQKAILQAVQRPGGEAQKGRPKGAKSHHKPAAQASSPKEP